MGMRAPAHNTRLGHSGPGRGSARPAVFVSHSGGGYPTSAGRQQPPTDCSSHVDNTAVMAASGGGLPGSYSQASPKEQNSGGPLMPCPDCGRKFVVESLEKHTRICKKVFLQRRKQFDSV